MSNALFGIGKRKTPLHKSIETLEDYLFRLKKYNEQIHVCGGRNSYSRTDHDATFMGMIWDFKNSKYRNDTGKTENMEYDAESDFHICRNDTGYIAKQYGRSGSIYDCSCRMHGTKSGTGIIKCINSCSTVRMYLQKHRHMLQCLELQVETGIDNILSDA